MLGQPQPERGAALEDEDFFRRRDAQRRATVDERCAEAAAFEAQLAAIDAAADVEQRAGLDRGLRRRMQGIEIEAVVRPVDADDHAEVPARAGVRAQAEQGMLEAKPVQQRVDACTAAQQHPAQVLGPGTSRRRVVDHA
ncbi:MAG: hypothetical protein AB1651_15565 [Pseudomonadota bacterium]